MKFNKAGIDLIKEYEGCSLMAYPDPATKGEPYTIGYGATGNDIGPNTIWTQAQAEKALLADTAGRANQIARLLTVQLTDNQFSAIISLVYNIGVGNFKSSTMLKLLNAGGINSASMEFPKWDKANGKEMPGLLKRRLAEQALFNS